MEGDLAPEHDARRVVIRYEGPSSPRLSAPMLCYKISEIFKVDLGRVRVRFGRREGHALAIETAYKNERRFGDRPHQVDSLQAFIAAHEPSMANWQLELQEIEQIPSAPSSNLSTATSGHQLSERPRKNTGRNGSGFPDDRRATGHGHPGLTPAGEPRRRPPVGRQAAPGSAWPGPLVATGNR